MAHGQMPDRRMGLHQGEQGEQQLYCICKRPYDERLFMIGCDKCGDWFHGHCVGIAVQMAEHIEKYFCYECRRKNKGLKIEYKDGSKGMAQHNGKEGEEAAESVYCARDDCPTMVADGRLSKYCSKECSMIVGHRLMRKYMQRVAPGEDNGVPPLLVKRLKQERDRHMQELERRKQRIRTLHEEINAFLAHVERLNAGELAVVEKEQGDGKNTGEAETKRAKLETPVTMKKEELPEEEAGKMKENHARADDKAAAAPDKEQHAQATKDGSSKGDSAQTSTGEATTRWGDEDGQDTDVYVRRALPSWTDLNGTITCFLCSREFTLAAGLKHMPQCFRATELKFPLLGAHAVRYRFCPVKAFCNTKIGKRQEVCQHLDVFCFQHSSLAKAMWKIKGDRRCGFFARSEEPTDATCCKRTHKQCPEHLAWQFCRLALLYKEITSESYYAQIADQDAKHCATQLAQQHMLIMHAMHSVEEVPPSSEPPKAEPYSTPGSALARGGPERPEWLRRRDEVDPYVQDNSRPAVTAGTKSLPKHHWR